MTLIASSVPSLLGGVSQQPASVRFPNQCEKSDNALASVVDGLVKRPPAEHIAKVVDGDPGASMIHTIDRGVGERYALILRNADAKIFDLTTGDEVDVYDSDGNEADATDFVYLTSSDPVADFRAASIADYTFVLNTTKVAAMSADTNPAAEDKAFLFIQQSAYEVDYKVTLKSSSDAATEVVDLSTWDGNSTDNVTEVIRVTVNTPGGIGPWTGSALGTSWSAFGGVSSNALANAVSNAIGAVQGVTAATPGFGLNYFDVTCDHAGLDMRLILDAAPATGSWSLTTITDDTETQENSIKTTVLAERLASEINALTNWSASAEASTVKVEPTSGTVELVEVEDSVGNTYLKRIYRTVDAITDLPLTCDDGFLIKVNGDPSAHQDDYYLEFEAEVADAFGPGSWNEAAGAGELQGFDSTSMPHTLIRKFDDGAGAITGTPYAKYFEWATYAWTDRVAGDSETNSNPSFIGKTINGIFLHQNRLGLLSDQNMILSEVGLYDSFWRTTVITVLDSDPIDIGVGHTRVSLLNHAVSFNQRLYLFSDRTQFVVNQNPMTPANTTVVTSAEYENSKNVGGVSVGSSIYFPFDTEGFGRILELYPTGETATSVEVIDATKHIPRFMSGTIKTLSGSTTESLLVATSTNNPNSLFVLSYFEQGKQRVQSAWQRFVFGSDAEVVSAEFIEEVLYLLIKRSEGLFLESVTFGSGIVDTDGDFRVTIDRRLAETDLTTVAYDAPSDLTTLTLPYDLDSNESYQAVTRAVNGKNDAFNLLSDTEDFSGGSWTNTGVDVVRNTDVAPDGETTADSLTASLQASNVKQEVAVAPVIGTDYTWSFYAKKDLQGKDAECDITLYNVGTAAVIERIKFNFDTVSGALTLLAGSTSQGPLGEYTTQNLDVKPEGDWWRVSGTLRYFATNGAGDVVDGSRIEIFPIASEDTERTVVVWGAQLLQNNEWEEYNRTAGRVLNVDSTGTNTIVVRGDYTTTPLWIGEQYLMQYQFSEINLKETSSTRRGKGIVADAQYYLRHGTLLYDNTGYFRVLVRPLHRGATVHQFTTTILGGTVGLQDGKTRFSAIGKAEDLDIFIENDSPLPSNILGVEWTALYNSKSARFAV
jgi:hypothetical protein